MNDYGRVRVTTCPFPDCGRPLEGLARFCHACGRYAEDYRPEGERKAAVEDTRSEKEIQTATVRALRAMGMGVWSLSQPRATMQTEGVADLFVTGRGICAWVEMKSATGRQSDDQEKFQRAVEANGGLYILARSEHDVVEVLTNAAGARA